MQKQSPGGWMRQTLVISLPFTRGPPESKHFWLKGIELIASTHTDARVKVQS